MNYPNRGSHQINTVKEEKHTIFANRGMDFENDINMSLESFDDHQLAAITKQSSIFLFLPKDNKLFKAYFSVISHKFAYFKQLTQKGDDKPKCV